jgi:membrane protease YdiL (CAAX protease family)
VTTAAIANASGFPVPERAQPPGLSGRAILTVLFITVGWNTLGCVYQLLRESQGRLSGFEISVSNTQLWSLVGYEILVGILGAAFLWRRGWRLEHITVAPAWLDLLRGVGVWLLALVSVWVVLVAFLNIMPQGLARPSRFLGEISWPPVLAVSLINPVFEEFLFLGFLAMAFREAGRWRIGVLSVALRVLVHTYQGALSPFMIGPIGAVFVTYYLRTRRLWVVILAHAVQDVIALGYLASHSGP